MPINPNPGISPLPAAPLRPQPGPVFSPAAATFVAALDPFGDDLQATADWMEGVANQTETWANEAETSATTATTQAGIATTEASTATTQAGIAVAAAASATLAPGTSATSTSTITPGYGSKSFTLVETGKEFVIDQFVTVSDPTSTAPNLRWFNGKITAFNSGTGAITVESGAFMGMVSGSSWVITGSAPAFGQRFTNPTQSFVALGTVSGTVNLDLRITTSFIMTIGGNTNFTFTMPDGFGATDQIGWELDITMGGTLYTIGYPAGTDYHEGANPITAINTRDIIGVVKKGTADAVVGRLRRAIA